jgi:hypothetical protein
MRHTAQKPTSYFYRKLWTKGERRAPTLLAVKLLGSAIAILTYREDRSAEAESSKSCGTRKSSNRAGHNAMDSAL